MSAMLQSSAVLISQALQHTVLSDWQLVTAIIPESADLSAWMLRQRIVPKADPSCLCELQPLTMTGICLGEAGRRHPGQHGSDSKNFVRGLLTATCC